MWHTIPVWYYYRNLMITNTINRFPVPTLKYIDIFFKLLYKTVVTQFFCIIKTCFPKVEIQIKVQVSKNLVKTF